MKAGRPRSFNVPKSLDSAMNVFWRKGYEGASLADLTAAMGINSPSLYAAFGSKEGLFRAVLNRYDDKRQEFLDRVLSAPTVREVARLFLEGVADYAADPKNLPGCLLIQSGLTCSDDAVPREVARHRAEKEKALAERFERGHRDGDLPRSADAASLARYVMTVSNGMAVQAAAGATAEDLRMVARMAIEAWPGGKSARKRSRVAKISERRKKAA